MMLSHAGSVFCGMSLLLVVAAEPSSLPAQALSAAASPTAAGQPVEAESGTPQVGCSNGKLTIIAEDVRLRRILAAVQGCIGVPMDVPADAANERSYVHLGPGPASDVLDALLSGTDLDYVLQSSSTKPETIQRVLLFARATETGEAQGVALPSDRAVTPARRAWLASRDAARVDRIGQNDQDAAAAAPDSGASSGSEAPVPADAAVSRAPAAAETAVPAQENAPPAPIVTGTSEGNTSEHDATADKLLQNKINDMQQLFEQRKKMATNPGSAPNQN